jgi:hypothetical protein
MKTSFSGALTCKAVNSADAPVSLIFRSGVIEIACDGDNGSSRMALDITQLTGMSAGTYYYPARKLKECLRAMDGTLQLQVGQGGILLMSTQQASCVLVSLRAPTVKTAAPRKKAA